jgi:hypothetical protein
MKKLYVALAQIVQAYHACVKSGNHEWQVKHAERLGKLVHEHMPSGSGIDTGTSLNLDKSSAGGRTANGRTTDEKLVFETSYHHMNEHGVYICWTDHTITVTASLSFGISIRIGGRNRNETKDYLYEVFHAALMTEVED